LREAGKQFVVIAQAVGRRISCEPADMIKHTRWQRCSAPSTGILRLIAGTASRFGSSKIRSRYEGVEEPLVRILVVEDDPLIREFVVEALREEGYDVIHAANGEEALAWCLRRVADVLFTDIKLPGHVDGWQIAERLLAGRGPSRAGQPVLAEALPSGGHR
jgi:PleD family two-component response regulator